MKKLVLTAAIAALGVSAQVHAAFVPIQIDRDGATGGLNPIQVTTLNWFAGNALTAGALGTVGASPADLAGERTLTTTYQAALNTFVLNSGGGSTSTSPTAGSEWTVQATLTETVTGIGTASVALVPTGGTVSIFYDPIADANDITGTGYGLEGGGVTEILRGTIVGGSGSFTDFTRLFPGLFPASLLDPFGADNQGGVLTHIGSGQSTIKVDIGATLGDFINPNFFLTDITQLIFALTGQEDVNDTGQLVAPFSQANPSDLVVGVTPSYSPNVTGGNGGDCPIGGGGTFSQRCDFHFQALNTTSFQAVPEPGTLAILGLGLGLLGVFNRQRKVTA